MGRMLPYLPLFVALSASSPFWQWRLTGLQCYRLAAYDELPRTGLPDLFANNEEFNAYIEALVRAGIMEDSSYVWWAIRPSATFPTLELRAPDCCTRLDDAIAIAALYRALARHLFYNRGGSVTMVDRAIAQENKWRAQRFGIHGSFVTRAGAVPVAEFLETVIATIDDDARVLGCTQEVERCRAIVCDGTSADAQIEIFHTRAAQDGIEAALIAVMEWIAANTLA
jgi:carboxylate-amine ligase